MIQKFKITHTEVKADHHSPVHSVLGCGQYHVAIFLFWVKVTITKCVALLLLSTRNMIKVFEIMTRDLIYHIVWHIYYIFKIAL